MANGWRGGGSQVLTTLEDGQNGVYRACVRRGWRHAVGEDLVVVLVFLVPDTHFGMLDVRGSGASFRMKSLAMRAIELGQSPQRGSEKRAYVRGESWHHSLFQKPV